MPAPHEIFAQMPPAAAEQFCTFLLENEWPLYQTTLDTLAKQRKLRSLFVERKRPAEGPRLKL